MNFTTLLAVIPELENFQAPFSFPQPDRRAPSDFIQLGAAMECLGFLRAHRSWASSLHFPRQSQGNLPGKVWDQEEMLPAAHPCAGRFQAQNISRSKESWNCSGFPQGSALFHTRSKSPSPWGVLWVQGRSTLPSCPSEMTFLRLDWL